MNYRKLYNQKYFDLKKLDGTDLHIECYSDYGSNRYGFRHVLYIDCYMGFEYRYQPDFKQCWCNRTWERFTYETVLNKFLDSITNPLTKEYYKKQIEDINNNDLKHLDLLINNFKENYAKTSDNFKKILSQSNINSVDDIKELNKLCILDNLFNNTEVENDR